MNKPQGIIVFGANGSGKSTLGRELARFLKYKYMDIEDYYFEESDIPYTKSRSREDCLILMLADTQRYGSLIISAVTGNLGEEISSKYDLAIHITTPLEIRMKRIEQREYERFGVRFCKGGDMYKGQQKFHDFVASRSLDFIDAWANTLVCPVLTVDGTKPIAELIKQIGEHIK